MLRQKLRREQTWYRRKKKTSRLEMKLVSLTLLSMAKRAVKLIHAINIAGVLNPLKKLIHSDFVPWSNSLAPYSCVVGWIPMLVLVEVVCLNADVTDVCLKVGHAFTKADVTRKLDIIGAATKQ